MFNQLPDFPHETSLPPTLDELPRIMPFFFVPPLENKPQNPIMESLKLERLNTNLPHRNPRPCLPLPEELVSLALEDNRIRIEENSFKRVEELWKGAALRKLGVKNGLLSWDRLRQTHSTLASPTPFLSEQGNPVSTSVRYYVQPRLYTSSANTIHVSQKDLLLNLKMTVLGVASQYHVWEPGLERFVQIGGQGSGDEGWKKAFLIIDGNDEVVSHSFVRGFLKIGTLLRRLEIFLSGLRTRSSKEGPTIHSLAHSLSTTLDYLREVLGKCQPSNAQIKANSKDYPLLDIWSQYEIYEKLLDALSDLYGRGYELSPNDYPVLDLEPVSLLSRIYEHTNSHFERQSPTIIRATLCFLLTTTSQDYLQDVARSVGFGGQLPESRLKSAKRLNDEYNLDLDDDDDYEQEDIFDLLEKIETSFPTFFPQKVLNLLPASQKSLVLLQIAKPDHPLLTSSTRTSSVHWFWSTKEILACWDRIPLSTIPQPPLTSSISSPLPTEPIIPDFAIFDLEPGTTTKPNLSIQVRNEAFTVLSTFIQTFPEDLPPIVPTLPELTSLVFRDLTEHSATLSSSLLSLIIDEPGNLNFRSHLIILRSYLFVAAPSFKSRLLNALFSDAGEYKLGNSTAHSMSLRRRSDTSSTNGSKQPWAVGLSPNLLEREMWPPVGADLSFFLRTVIVDSLDKGTESEDGKMEREQVVEEAGWRLGFAIRDLPTGSGRDKWLDPLCIEALDFLYMDYKPPHLMEILISPNILAKYQRMFTFIMRLFRVESALKSLFRMSTHRDIANTLFPTLSQSRKLLLHFRFISQAFVSSLSGYVFDTAIRGNFDPFLDQLSGTNANAELSHEMEDSAGQRRKFSDVFELAQQHSTLLDDILSACLLRSGQRGVGDLLRHCLELVLEFTIVVGELHRGRIQEYQAAPMIEELFKKFCIKMTTFTKVLKGLVDKCPSASSLAVASHLHGNHGPTGGLEALHHLLVRIDLISWWSNLSKGQPPKS